MPRMDALLRSARPLLQAGEAELLLAHASGRTRSWLFAHGDQAVPPGVARRFAELLARRLAGEPVAYLLGSQGFWSLDLQVSAATLIPRPETEWLVQSALARLPPARPARVADLGTGSGAIALALAHERPCIEVVATDASAEALTVARANAARLGVHNVTFRQGDWFAALPGERFDLIASNPPYIADADPHLARGDLRHEPLGALASGPDGLDALRILTAGASAHLQPGGWLLLEHGTDQGQAVRGLLAGAGLLDIATIRDDAGHERVGLARAP